MRRSFADARRFGNFIGEADESEEAESVHEPTAADAYLDDDEAEEDVEINNQQLMEVDGIVLVLVSPAQLTSLQTKVLRTL